MLGREAVGAWLAEQRARAGLSQRAVSVALDVDSQTVSRWETGRHPISAESFFALVRLYGAEAHLPALLARRCHEWA